MSDRPKRGKRRWETARRDERERRLTRRRAERPRPTRYQIGYRWGAALASGVADLRKYWRAQLISLGLIAAGLLLGAWVAMRLRFAGSFGQAVAIAGAYLAVKLAVQELALHLPNVFKVGVSQRAHVGRWLKEAGVAILPDMLAAALGVYTGKFGSFAFGVCLSGFLSCIVYAMLFDADEFDAKAGGVVNALLGALLMGAWWWVGTRYLVGV